MWVGLCASTRKEQHDSVPLMRKCGGAAGEALNDAHFLVVSAVTSSAPEEKPGHTLYHPPRVGRSVDLTSSEWPNVADDIQFFRTISVNGVKGDVAGGDGAAGGGKADMPLADQPLADGKDAVPSARNAMTLTQIGSRFVLFGGGVVRSRLE